MSFGFSIGDFIAGANLAYRLLRALSDTQGASAEYQEVIHELGCIQQTFLHVEQMRSSNLFSQATLNAISFIINSSIDIMAKFLDRSEKYRQSLSHNLRHPSATDSWRKIGWSLFKSEELTSLRDTLHIRLTAVGILVSTASHQNQYIIPQAVGRFQTGSFETETLQQKDSIIDNVLPEPKQKIEKRESQESHGVQARPEKLKENIDDQTDSLEDDLRKAAEQEAIEALVNLKLLIQRSSQDPSPESEKKKPIRFKDALGRKFSFPFSLCSTWAGMEHLIRQAFLHVEVIGQHVMEGHYDLVGPNGAIILPQFWETAIEPDLAITMHMWPLPMKPEEPALEKEVSDTPLSTEVELDSLKSRSSKSVLSRNISKLNVLGRWKTGSFRSG